MIWLFLTLLAIILAFILFFRVVFSSRPKTNRRVQKKAPLQLRKSFSDWRAKHLSNKPKSTEVKPQPLYTEHALEKSAPLLDKLEDEVADPENEEIELANEPIDTSQQEKRKIHAVIPIYLLAPPHQNYRGYELLQALLTAGLRFGAQKIFYRYENKQVKGDVLFSLASIQKPGTFEISRMGAHECPGLVLFMTVDGSVDHLHAFELMIETAKQLEEDLGGELFDEHHQPLTPEIIAQMSENIERFEYEQRSPDLFSS